MTRQYNEMPTVKSVNVLYMFCMLMFVGVGELLERLSLPLTSYNQKMAIITLAQIVFVFIPTLIYIYINRVDYKRGLRLNKVSFINIILSAGIILFAVPVTAFLNYIVILILNYFGKLHMPPNFPSDTVEQLFINLFVIAVVPALFEELLFRGTIMRGYERLGIAKAIIFSSLLFALLHRDLQSLIGTFLLGMIIAYIVYRTNSIYAGMTAHFTNNGFALIITFIVLKLQKFVEQYSPQVSEQLKSQMQNPSLPIPNHQLLIAFFALGIIALMFGTLLFGLLVLFNHTTKDINRDIQELETKSVKIEKSSAMPLIISVILVLYVYIKQLI